MKLIFVTSEQFNLIWMKLQPQQRISANMLAPNIVIAHLNAVIVLREAVTIGSIEAFPLDEVTISWLNETILQKKYFEVG